MTDCDAPTKASQPMRCPGCAHQGRAVAIQTVRALVAISLRILAPDGYRFCATPRCPIVYYGSENGQLVTVDQLREPVYQKVADQAQVLICYCFQYTIGAVRHADPAQRAAILDDITAGTRLGQCACDLRNPQGSCCLGNVRRLIDRTDDSVVAQYAWRDMMHQEPEALPIACNPKALSAETWAAHQAQGHQLFQQAVVARAELPDGYAFRFPATALLAVAAFVDNERRCCPFFTFTLVVPPGAEAITLQITGNPEAKAVIAAELLPR